MSAAVLAAVALTLAVAVPAAAAPAYPRAQGRCVDQAGVLGGALCARVTAILLRDEKATTDEIAVAVVPSTGEAAIEAWSTGLFNAWGVGKRDRDNGVLLVVAVDDRRVRLETGRGLARRLPDAEAARIVDDVVTPAFRRGDRAAGILAGLDEVRRALGHDVPRAARLTALAAQAQAPTVAPVSDPVPAADVDGLVGGDYDDEPFDSGGSDSFGGAVLLVFLGVGALLLILVAAGRGGGGSGPHRHDGTAIAPTWSPVHHSTFTGSSGGGSSGSDSSGSGSSFGGGGSDGGGASGSW
ncbi:hypothetical protein Sya03_37880 [Spirilliplanes yamanashiensis]|uniref:TPM domain-containing protein n=2 Tax=Spirilliplanes yamanashiensis TaxID=42233 RepID=A0A8J4DK19_9ACTN|nr:hypothetical protein Sya03_37880 [Spirilliplanes yamanashiensis]